MNIVQTGTTKLIRVLVATGALMGCKPNHTAPPPSTMPEVGVITVKPQALTSTTELPGRTVAIVTSDIRPQVQGVVLKRLFVEGSDVRQGQQLYQIDPATYEAAYDSARATMAHDEAALATSKGKARRYKPLAAAQAVSGQDYDDAQAASKEAQADLLAARAAIVQARINLDYTKVLSPISGHIGRSAVTAGALVTANQATALATVTQLDPIFIQVNQPVTALLRFRRELAAGQIKSAVPGTAKVTLTLEDGSPYDLPGTLQFTEVTVDQGTGSVLLQAVFPNPQHQLLPGMYVHAELQEGVDQGAIVVPQESVSRNTHGDPTVLVVGDDGKAALRVVQTGRATAGHWIITAGLHAGDRVAVDGLQKVRPGMEVRPVAVQTAPALPEPKS